MVDIRFLQSLRWISPHQKSILPRRIEEMTLTVKANKKDGVMGCCRLDPGSYNGEILLTGENVPMI